VICGTPSFLNIDHPQRFRISPTGRTDPLLQFPIALALKYKIICFGSFWQRFSFFAGLGFGTLQFRNGVCSRIEEEAGTQKDRLVFTFEDLCGSSGSSDKTAGR